MTTVCPSILVQFEISLRFWVPKGRNLVAVGERSDTHGMRQRKKLLTLQGSNICMNATPFRVGEIMLKNPWVSLRSPTAIELHPFGMKPRYFPILEFQSEPVPADSVRNGENLKAAYALRFAYYNLYRILLQFAVLQQWKQV